ncbi:MAG TPA: hypothetical protein VMH38_09065 [Thermoplasmata archaeon]|nr:hypothetical protein [Thermoplasmata archaeon]
MLRTERPRLPSSPVASDRAQLNSREMLLAVAPPPTTRALALEGWPSWLIPAYRSGGHRPEVKLLEEER